MDDRLTGFIRGLEQSATIEAEQHHAKVDADRKAGGPLAVEDLHRIRMLVERENRKADLRPPLPIVKKGVYNPE